jgi:hypothetical protein
MQLDDTLDTLLSRQGQDGLPAGEQTPANGILAEHEASDLQPLLDAADRLAELRGMEPSSDFAGRLETRYFAWIAQAEADTLAHNGTDSSVAPYDPAPFALPASASTPRPDHAMPAETPPLLGNDFPTLPGILWRGGAEYATEADPTLSRRAVCGRQGERTRRARWARLLGPAMAAALLLVIGGSTLTAAAAAGPGTPFYSLHRWEQNVQVSMAGSAGDRTRLHLAYAQAALAALDAAAARHQAGAPYNDALATFRDEMSAASATLDSVPASGEHDELTAQLAQVRAKGRADLRTALVALPWSERVATTSALATIGDSVLQVAHASAERLGQGQHLWQITVTGAGFQQGAVLLVDGQPAGAVTSVTATGLVAQVSRDDSAPLPNSIGVANPDNTAAATRTISSDEPEPNGTPTPQQTPDGDDHGGNDGGGSGSDGGGHSRSGSGSGSGSPGGSGSGSGG